MTEEEALYKLCPQTLALAQVRSEYFQNASPACCIASGCMAFRWVDDAIKELSHGITVFVDKHDSDLLNGKWWTGHYAKGENGYLHREVAVRIYGLIPRGMFVDHIDGNPLNNRRGNIRIVTPSENAANASTRGGKSMYRGVSMQHSGRWTAQISKSGIRICLGTFDTEEEAAKAYDNAARDIHGAFARLNLTKITNSGRTGYCDLAGGCQKD